MRPSSPLWLSARQMIAIAARGHLDHRPVTSMRIPQTSATRARMTGSVRVMSLLLARACGLSVHGAGVRAKELNAERVAEPGLEQLGLPATFPHQDLVETRIVEHEYDIGRDVRVETDAESSAFLHEAYDVPGSQATFGAHLGPDLPGRRIGTWSAAYHLVHRRESSRHGRRDRCVPREHPRCVRLG